MEQGLICPKSMSLIQKGIDSICKPHYVGRIPYKIASSFSGLTADQFNKLWLCTTNEHLLCWYFFVQPSRLLCQMMIRDAQILIKLADAFPLQFCCRVEKLYSKGVVTPNMHLHCHLKQLLYDYGPILVIFVRWNFREFLPSNNHSLEIHMMQCCTQECALQVVNGYLQNLSLIF